MKETIFLLNDSGQLIELSEAPYDSEDLLQKLLSDYPKLLSGSQIDPDEPRRWILVSRELGVAGEENGANRWSLDHLFLDQDAIPTLVEVKRSTDTRLRREVIGQIMDYAANAVSYWKIDNIRNQFEQLHEDPESVLAELLGPQEEVEDYWEQVGTNLQAGKVRMLIVADVIPRELQRIIEFLNQQMSPAEILGVEIKQYVGEGRKTMVPRIVGQTAGAASRKSGGRRSPGGVERDEASYFKEMEEYAGAERAAVAREIFDWVHEYSGHIWYGKGQLGSGSFVPITYFPKAGKKLKVQHFAVWTRGQVEIYFQHYREPPMDDWANRRLLMNMLNKIDGVDIQEDQLDKRPNFDLLLLKGDGMALFKAAFEWFYERYQVG
jgi:hypothetical protein